MKRASVVALLVFGVGCGGEVVDEPIDNVDEAVTTTSTRGYYRGALSVDGKTLHVWRPNFAAMKCANGKAATTCDIDVVKHPVDFTVLNKLPKSDSFIGPVYRGEICASIAADADDRLFEHWVGCPNLTPKLLKKVSDGFNRGDAIVLGSLKVDPANANKNILTVERTYYSTKHAAGTGSFYVLNDDQCGDSPECPTEHIVSMGYPRGDQNFHEVRTDLITADKNLDPTGTDAFLNYLTYAELAGGKTIMEGTLVHVNRPDPQVWVDPYLNQLVVDRVFFEVNGPLSDFP